MPDDGALRFAERLLALLDATRYSATYKLATLLALIDVAAEGIGPDGSAPATLSAKEVGRRVIEFYWPQTVPYGSSLDAESKVLSQSPQRDIPAKLAAWRAGHDLAPGASLGDAQAADPVGWADLEADLLAIVIGMPLAKLQRFGEGRNTVEDRFIYEYSWRQEVGASTVGRADFDDDLRLREGVGTWLVTLAPLIRPLVQAKWAARIAVRNADVVDAHRLNEFLFGAQRISLDRVRSPLAESQNRECFYCACRLGSRCAVDHFLPWSRHPDNSIDNLVAACPACNSAKSASLASLGHVGRWIGRFRPGPASDVIADVARSASWPRRSDRVLSMARATYLWLPEGTRLWRQSSIYEPLEQAEMRALFTPRHSPLSRLPLHYGTARD